MSPTMLQYRMPGIQQRPPMEIQPSSMRASKEIGDLHTPSRRAIEERRGTLLHLSHRPRGDAGGGVSAGARRRDRQRWRDLVGQPARGNVGERDRLEHRAQVGADGDPDLSQRARRRPAYSTLGRARRGRSRAGPRPRGSCPPARSPRGGPASSRPRRRAGSGRGRRAWRSRRMFSRNFSGISCACARRSPLTGPSRGAPRARARAHGVVDLGGDSHAGEILPGLVSPLARESVSRSGGPRAGGAPARRRRRARGVRHNAVLAGALGRVERLVGNRDELVGRAELVLQRDAEARRHPQPCCLRQARSGRLERGPQALRELLRAAEVGLRGGSARTPRRRTGRRESTWRTRTPRIAATARRTASPAWCP